MATEGGIVRAPHGHNQWQTVSLLGARENGIFGLLLEPDGRGGERLCVGTASFLWERIYSASAALFDNCSRA